MCHEADVEVLGGTVAQLLCAAHDGIDVAHRASRRLEQLGALGRQLDAPGHALEQRDAELGLEPADGEAERGLRDVQRLCRARDAACLRDGHELPELLDVEAHPARENHNAGHMGPRAIGIGRAAIRCLPSPPMSDTATKDATALPVPEPGLTPAEVIRRAEALRPRLLDDQAATEERTFYSEEMHQAFSDAGFYRILQPRMFGGYEFDVPTFYRVIIEVSRGCPSSGWCLSLNAAHALQAGAFYSERAQREMFGPAGDFRCAARDTPRGTARPVDGGYLVDGTWDYCSGSPWSTHLMAGAMLEDGSGTIEYDQFSGRQLLVTVPRESWEIVHDWGNMIGLRGSGSHSVRGRWRVRAGAHGALAQSARRRRQ